MKRTVNAEIILGLALILVLAACGPAAVESEPTDLPQTPESAAESEIVMGHGRGMGAGGGMMARHHADIPEPYAGLTNPVPADDASLDRGAEIYGTYCASCHGDGGMGDGPAGANLDPLPAPVAHTSLMLGNDYLFWRTSEGGAMEPFSSAMPAWKESLEEEARWDVINYMRALGSGQVIPQQRVGGEPYDPAAEAAAHAEMLAQGVAQQVITQEEAELFDRVHGAMDELVAAGLPEGGGSMPQRRLAILAELVKQGEISQAEADAFNDIHDRLVEAGLME